MSKQIEILEYINKILEIEGQAPSVREIAAAVNLKSTSSVQHHLDNLVKKGLLSKKANLSRSISNNKKMINFKTIPVIGEISAGTPLLAEENMVGEIPIVEEKYNKDLFALKVSGDSMIEAGIYDGDIVVVDKNIEPKNGEVGAFMINQTEATVKYLDTISGKKFLIPANKNYKNFEVNEKTQPVGKAVSLFRDI